jgi:hypothetical protein
MISANLQLKSLRKNDGSNQYRLFENRHSKALEIYFQAVQLLRILRNELNGIYLKKGSILMKMHYSDITNVKGDL